MQSKLSKDFARQFRKQEREARLASLTPFLGATSVVVDEEQFMIFSTDTVEGVLRIGHDAAGAFPIDPRDIDGRFG